MLGDPLTQVAEAILALNYSDMMKLANTLRDGLGENDEIGWENEAAGYFSDAVRRGADR